MMRHSSPQLRPKEHRNQTASRHTTCLRRKIVRVEANASGLEKQASGVVLVGSDARIRAEVLKAIESAGVGWVLDHYPNAATVLSRIRLTTPRIVLMDAC